MRTKRSIKVELTPSERGLLMVALGTAELDFTRQAAQYPLKWPTAHPEHARLVRNATDCGRLRKLLTASSLGVRDED